MTHLFAHAAPGSPTTVSLDAPDGWSPIDVDGAVLAIAHDGDATPFRPNVCVTVVPHDPGYRLEDAVAEVRAAYHRSEEFAELGHEVVDVAGGAGSGTSGAGTPGFRVEGAFVEPGVGTLFQATTVTVVRVDDRVDLVQVVGSCAATDAERLVPVIRTVIAGVVVTSDVGVLG